MGVYKTLNQNCMKLKSFILIISAIIGVQMFGQQDPQYTQYMYNMNIVNPAYAGSNEALSIGLLGRTQWVGLNGAPKTATFSAHAPMGNNLGMGLSIMTDEIGPLKETNVYTDFSYTIQTSEVGKLAFGLKGGLTFHYLGLATLATVSPDVNFSENTNRVYPNFGVGIFYYTDQFYMGASLPNMIESNHFERSGGIISKASEKMHYFLTSGVVFNLSDRLKFKPSFMAKTTVGTPLSVDVSANFLIDEKLELGTSYRLDDAVSALINFAINKNLRIGYAYDYTVSNIGQFNSGTHEVILLYDFKLFKYKSPRFF